MTKKKKPLPPQVVLHEPDTALATLVFAKALYGAIAAAKGVFVTPDPPLAQLSTDIAALDAAEAATHTRALGAVDARDTKLTVVRVDLRRVRVYVQGLVNADPGHAAEIVNQAGLRLRNTPTRNKSEVSAKPNKKTSGAVDVVARVGAVRASHDWEYSSDGGKTWAAAPSTLAGRTTLHGFLPGTTLLVRHRAVTKTGPDNWSNAVPVVVV